MSDTYKINESNQVVPYTSGRKCTDTRAWRDATDLELQQQEQIEQLERELDKARKQRDTLVEAMTEYMNLHIQHGFVTTAETIKAWQALVAVKGGLHD